MNIQRSFGFVFIAIASTLVSCGGDGDDEYKYKFKDQDAQGEIGGTGWIYKDGFASIVDFDEDDIRVSVDLVLEQEEQGCDIFGIDGNAVFFSVPNEVGVYKLKFDLSGDGSDSYTVTLFRESDFMNFIAAEGAVEILSISETEVTGRLDAYVDKNTHVNGNFTVSICAN